MPSQVSGPSPEEWEARHNAFSGELEQANSFEDIADALQSYLGNDNEIVVFGQGSAKGLTLDPRPIIAALRDDPLSLETNPRYMRYDSSLAEAYDRVRVAQQTNA